MICGIKMVTGLTFSLEDYWKFNKNRNWEQTNGLFHWTDFFSFFFLLRTDLVSFSISPSLYSTKKEEFSSGIYRVILKIPCQYFYHRFLSSRGVRKYYGHSSRFDSVWRGLKKSVDWSSGRWSCQLADMEIFRTQSFIFWSKFWQAEVERHTFFLQKNVVMPAAIVNIMIDIHTCFMAYWIDIELY